MKNRSFLLALALGLSISSQALLSSEQDIESEISSSDVLELYIQAVEQDPVHFAIDDLQCEGLDLFQGVVFSMVEKGQRLDLNLTEKLITMFKLEEFRTDLGRYLFPCSCCPCVDIAPQLFFEYIQDFVELKIFVVGDIDLIDAVIQKFPNLQEKLYADEALLATFQETIEILIAKGFDRAPYDVFMVEFETYKADQK